MKNLLLLLLLSFSICANTQTIKHGVVLGVSDSWLKTSDYPGGGFGLSPGFENEKWKARMSFNIGYQLKYDIKDRFVLDAAMLFNSRGVHVNIIKDNIEKADETKRFNALALNGVFNYKIWKGIRLGAGIEPTFYWNTKYWDNLKKTAFDVPLVVKAGYDFNFMEVSLSYKHGLKPIMEGVGHAYKAKTRDVQLSVFLPLGKFGL